MKHKFIALAMSAAITVGATLGLAACNRQKTVMHVEVNNRGELIVTMTDGEVKNLGSLSSDANGVKSVEINSSGELVFTLDDGSNINCGKVTGGTGEAGNGVKNAYLNNGGNLILVLDDGTLVDCGNVYTGEYGSEGMYYTQVKENGEVIGYVLRDLGNLSDADVRIPSEYRGMPVISIGENAFFNSKYITSVTIPDTVQTLEYCSFWGCQSLESVTIGKGVNDIGEAAFTDCTALKEITIPSNVKTIGENAFSGCYSLEKITVENGVTSIGRSAFTGCTMADDFIMPDSVTEIGHGVFMNSMFKNIKLSSNLTVIPGYTFASCNGLESIVIGDKVKSIRYSALFDMGALQYIVLPKSLEIIEPYGIWNVGMPRDVGTPEAPEQRYGVDIFYKGTESDWDKVKKGVRDTSAPDEPGMPLTLDGYALDGYVEQNGRAIETNNLDFVYFYSETQPSEQGSYWHYVDGEPVKW